MGDRLKLLDEITRSIKGYTIAVFTSFNFEVEFFERTFLGRLFDGGVRKVSLFVDRGEFEKALNNVSDRMPNLGLGAKYIVSPVDLNGSFHPKIVLLLGEKKAKLIVASANIYTTGHKRNNEVFNVIEYSERDTRYQDVIVAAINYILQIDKVSYGLDSQMIKELKHFPCYSKAESNGVRHFLGNCDIPMMDQMIGFLPESVDEIKIAVPYFDEKLDALNRLMSTFPNASVTLYIQQGKSTFPEGMEGPFSIKIFDRFNDISSDYSGNFYHGKVFLFKTGEKDYIVYGSANCTGSALLRSHRTGGNIECDIMDEGESGEFDLFFDSLHIIEGEQLKTHPSDSDLGVSKPFRFISATMHRNYIECHLRGTREVKQVTFSYAAVELEHERQEADYTVRIDLTEENSVPRLFNLDFVCDGEVESVRCWIIDPVSLSNNRREISGKDEFDDFEEDSTGMKYQEDRYKLMKADLMCIAELMEFNKTMAMAQQQNALIEDVTDESDDDFMDYTEISYEYREMHRRYKTVENIRTSFLNRFLHPERYFKSVKEGAASPLSSTESSEKEGEVKLHIRQATSEDKQFERFVKNRLKGFLDKRYIEAVSFDHYMGLVQVVLEIFKKYNRHEIPWVVRNDDKKVEGIFDDEYIIRTKTAMTSALLSKDLSNAADPEYYTQKIVLFSIGVILENHMMISGISDHELSYDLNKGNRDILLLLESKYGIREQLSSYVQLATSQDHNVAYRIVERNGIPMSVDYLNETYGYRGLNSIISEIKKRYGEATTGEIKDGVFYITVETVDIGMFFRLDVDMVNTIAAYCRNTKTELKKIIMNVDNKAPMGQNPIVKLKSIVIPKYSKWSQDRLYADGSTFKIQSKSYGTF